MKKILVFAVLFLLLSAPALADDGDGRFGVDAGFFFFDNSLIDDNSWFAGIEYTADVWSIELDYTAPATVAMEGGGGGGDDQFMLVHLDYLYYFNQDSYDEEMPAYLGVGYSHRFNGQTVDDGGGFNVIFGFDWDENWNFEAKYIRFDDDDTIWGIGAAYFFDWGSE